MAIKARGALVAVIVVLTGLGVSGIGNAAVPRDGTPTTLAKQAKRFGITKSGPKYRFEEQSNNSDTLFLTVDIPTAWSAVAESRFVDPTTNERYGVGLRATTDEDLFRNSFDVPGARVTADGLTPDEIDAYDGAERVADNAFEGCHNGSVRPFDNGKFEGSYQTYDRCDGKKGHGALVVGAVGDGIEILVAAQLLTKADLKALDRLLRTIDVEKTSV